MGYSGLRKIIKKLTVSETHFDSFFHTHTVHLDITKVFYSPTDVQVNCLKNNFKITKGTSNFSKHE